MLRRLAIYAVLLTAGLGALAPAPSSAATTDGTCSNTAAIQGQRNFGSPGTSDPIAVSASGTPVGSAYPSTVHVSGVAGTITYLSLQLHVAHTAPDDLDVLLVAPSGKAVVLMSDAGGFTDFDGPLGFSTSIVTSLPDSAALTPGYYAATNWVGNDGPSDVWPAPAPVVADPNASLTSLLGESPDGDWKLFVRDDQDQDGGVIKDWSFVVSTDAAVPIPAATFPSDCLVSGLTGTITDVDVTLDGVSWLIGADLDVMLVAPDGRKALVLSDVGGDQTMNGLTLTLDDEAGAALPAASAPPSGRYRPTNVGGGDTFPAPAPDASTAASALSVFDGADPNGTWKLYVVQDETTSKTGAIASGWSLRINTSGGSAPRVISTRPPAGAAHVRRGASIRATASEALRPATVTRKTVYLTRAGSARHIAARVSYLAGSHSILIDPTRRLKAGTRYRVTVTTAVRDADGVQLDQEPTKAGAQPKSWTFRTK